MRGPGRPEQRIPGRVADADHQGELALRDPEADGALEAAGVGQHVADGVLGAGLDREREEDRRLRERREHGLRLPAHWFHLSAVRLRWPELLARTLVTSGGVSAA